MLKKLKMYIFKEKKKCDLLLFVKFFLKMKKKIYVFENWGVDFFFDRVF